MFLICSWAHIIDFSKFHIAGGSLMTCLIQNPSVSVGQDIDLFYKGDSYNDYIKCFVSKISLHHINEICV